MQEIQRLMLNMRAPVIIEFSRDLADDWESLLDASNLHGGLMPFHGESEEVDDLTEALDRWSTVLDDSIIRRPTPMIPYVLRDNPHLASEHFVVDDTRKRIDNARKYMKDMQHA